jgi:N-acetylglucosamine-6-phosphate deacetylase
MNSLAIVNVKTCESENPVDVFIENGKIARILSAASCPPTAQIQTIDGTNLWLLPGFLDLHVHGAGGGAVLHGTNDALATMAATLARFGTTQFVATAAYEVGKDNRYLKVAADALGQNFGGARIAGIYLEGPFINPGKKGMIHPDFIAEPSEKILDHIFDLCGPALKIMAVAPELPGALKIIEKLVERGVVVSLGHSLATYEQACEGIAAGITHATHLFNAMPSIHHRNPGPIPALLQDDRVTIEFISDGAHIAPPVAWTIGQIVPPNRLCLITDGIEVLGCPDSDFVYTGRRVHSRNGIVLAECGSLVGTAVGQSEMISRFTKFTGWPIENAIRSAAITPRSVLGLADPNAPLLAEGRPADLVLADITEGQLTVHKTLVAGQTVYQRD